MIKKIISTVFAVAIFVAIDCVHGMMHATPCDSTAKTKATTIPIHLLTHVPMMTWKQFDPLNRENGEFEYYKCRTWDENKTLEQNRTALFINFISTCIDYLPSPKIIEITNPDGTEKIILTGISDPQHHYFVDLASRP